MSLISDWLCMWKAIQAVCILYPHVQSAAVSELTYTTFEISPMSNTKKKPLRVY